MLKKKQFEAPAVLQEVPIQLEADLLGRSVEETLKAITLGQEYEDHDMSYVNQDQPAYWE